MRIKKGKKNPQVWQFWSHSNMHPNDCENFVKTDWEVPLGGSDSVCLHLSWEFVFLIGSLVMLMIQVHGPHFEKHWYRVDILGLFGKTTHKLSTQSQLLSISEFPSRVNSNNPVLLEDPVLCAIANKHKQTSALVALRYQIQRGVVVLAKSYNKKRIKENIQVMGGAVGRGLLRNILHESHSLSLKTFLESRQVTCSSPCMNVLCVFLVIFSS